MFRFCRDVIPTVRRSLLIPLRGFPSSSNTVRLGSRLRDTGRLTERDAFHIKYLKQIWKARVLTFDLDHFSVLAYIIKQNYSGLYCIIYIVLEYK